MPSGHKILAILFYVGQRTWGIPVNLVGGLGWLYGHARGFHQERFLLAQVTYLPTRLSGGLSIGMFLFVPDRYRMRETSGWDRSHMVHEYGHTFQALILGILYLPLIGLPSLLWYALPRNARFRARRGLSYYWLYTEAWANRLGARVTGWNAPV
jgi:hypothetical protein